MSLVVNDLNDEDNNKNGCSKSHEKKIQRKQKRFQHMISKDSGVVCCDEPTQNLVVCNAGLSTGLDQTELVYEFTKYGAVSNVHLIRNKSYCFVVCADKNSAIKIYDETHAKSLLGQNDTCIYLTYCTEVPVNNVEDPSKHSLPSGLQILENFITPAEEEILIDLIESNQTTEQTNSVLKHRQVQHFGYEFKYDTNNVDISKPLVDKKIPGVCNFIWDENRKKRSNGILNQCPHQLTVNKYEPGQGIPLHVDTHSAFSDAIISLSLASDIVMEFRKPSVRDSKEYVDQVEVVLPRRSLLIMSGESRYGWKHGITPRKIDVIRNNDNCLTTKFRSKRISYTFRWLSSEECKCEFHSLCDTYQNQKQNENDTNNSIENPSQCELENVHKVYNEIANHFSETRHSPWPQVNEFIQQFEIGSVLIDVGCGNGKYLQSNLNIFEIGCDRSDGLLNVCRERQFNVFQCDCLSVPIRSESVDGCISIAVIHHLASEDRRKQAIREMIRILRPTGRCLIYVWAKNQALNKKESTYLQQNKSYNKKTTESNDDGKDITKSTSQNGLPVHTNRTQFEHTDILVPWKLKNPSKSTNKESSNDQHPTTYLRFYHVFEENELESLCKQFNNITIEKSYYDQGNWCVIFQKTSSN